MLDKSVLFSGYLGLGDQVYMRPFILSAKKKYKQVDLITPFPDLLNLEGTGINCIKPNTNLKTQKEWSDYCDWEWKERRLKYNIMLKPNYSAGFHKDRDVIETFKLQSGLEPESFLWQPKTEFKKKAYDYIKKFNTEEKPICFFRPPTVRSEWVCASRNAEMKYFHTVLDMLRKEYYIVSCTDTRNGTEWIDGDMPDVDLKIHNNEISLDGVLGLMAISSCMIGIQSNIIPFSCAFEVPCFVIYGGYVPHNVLVNPLMGDKIRHIQPDDFCFCVNGNHNCNKYIDIHKLKESFERFKKEVLC